MVPTPAQALKVLADAYGPVEAETLAIREAAGRFLANPIHSTRESPACDLSSMDGYAVRAADRNKRSLLVCGTSMPGREPPDFGPQEGRCIKIVTGAPVPAGAWAVVPREHVEELGGEVRFPPAFVFPAQGTNIRRRGENAVAGKEILAAGSFLSPAALSAAGAAGAMELRVRRLLRVAVLTTGDEVVEGAPGSVYEIGNSNGPALLALFRGMSWIDPAISIEHVPDNLAVLTQAVTRALAGCDALMLSGAVSMGDHDFVPAALGAAGVETLFHKLPIRPGRPLFAGVGPAGQVVLGLPGNPVSTLVTARRFALPALATRAGDRAQRYAQSPQVEVHSTSPKPVALWRYLPVAWAAENKLTLVANRSSGDILSLAGTAGFVELPPDLTWEGPLSPRFPFFSWDGS